MSIVCCIILFNMFKFRLIFLCTFQFGAPFRVRRSVSQTMFPTKVTSTSVTASYSCLGKGQLLQFGTCSALSAPVCMYVYHACVCLFAANFVFVSLTSNTLMLNLFLIFFCLQCIVSQFCFNPF